MTIGIVGPDDPSRRLADALDGAGASVVRGEAVEVLADEPAAVVAVGEPSAISLARAGAGIPVLPVAAGPGLGSVTLEEGLESIDRLVAGDYGTTDHPVLSVHLGDEPAGRALFDVMLVTSEPGRISEYGVETTGPVGEFRADGVVVATPAGSHGYARAAGGPIVDAGTGGLAVIPVSAFGIRSADWVLDPPVVITMERNEGEISLLVDDRERAGIPHDRPVRVDVADHLPVVSGLGP